MGSNLQHQEPTREKERVGWEFTTLVVDSVRQGGTESFVCLIYGYKRVGRWWERLCSNEWKGQRAVLF